MGYRRKKKGHIRVGVCAMLWAIWKVRNDFIFNKKKNPIIFAGNSFNHSLDPYVLLPIADGRASGFGYWVQPVGDGSTRFLQPVQLEC
jgi:hypothetical protein